MGGQLHYVSFLSLSVLFGLTSLCHSDVLTILHQLLPHLWGWDAGAPLGVRPTSTPAPPLPFLWPVDAGMPMIPAVLASFQDSTIRPDAVCVSDCRIGCSVIFVILLLTSHSFRHT